MTKTEFDPIGLYIHTPYCLKKCAYCDFSSLPLPGQEACEEYTRALQIEMALQAHRFDDYRVETLYIGGGTPSLFSASQLNSILKSTSDSFPITRDCEITIEANPATVSFDQLKRLQEAGVNRFSLGVQSLADDELQILGRAHRVRDSLDIIEKLHFLKLSNFNIDLIYGLPGQSIDRWQKNLEMAVKLQPAHISAYLLQLEPGTPLARDIERGLLTEADEETQQAMYDMTRRYLSGMGYEQYEISNFSRPGMECRHNLGYWRGRPYLGLGSAAVSFVGRERWINPWPPSEYQRCLFSGEPLGIIELESMNREDLLAEAMIMGLRMTAGVDPDEVERRVGLNPLHQFKELIGNLLDQGCLMAENRHLCLNPRYYFVSNQILCQFIALSQS